MYKTLGILGGMGPLATVKLFEKIVLKTNANCDQEHIHIFIDNNTKIPDRTSFILDNKKEDPRSELIDSAKKLESIGADFLVMPCNTAHFFYKDIIREISIPFINMIEATVKHIQEDYPEVKKVGLMSTEGTIKAEIYDSVFKDFNIEVLKPNKENQRYVSDLIYNIKSDIVKGDLDGFYSAMAQMEGEGAQIFIAGCTEISVAIDMYKLKGKFIDPLDVLTESVISFSGREIK